MVALTEMNRILPIASAAGLDTSFIDPRLTGPVDMDLRIMMSWNTNQTDMDLWVTEPTGEKVYYRNRDSKSGALLPADIVSGFGPEEYLSRFALQGNYKFQGQYFGNNSINLFGPTTVKLDIYKDYGRSNEQIETLTIRLDKESDIYDIGEYVHR